MIKTAVKTQQKLIEHRPTIDQNSFKIKAWRLQNHFREASGRPLGADLAPGGSPEAFGEALGWLLPSRRLLGRSWSLLGRSWGSFWLPRCLFWGLFWPFLAFGTRKITKKSYISRFFDPESSFFIEIRPQITNFHLKISFFFS